MCDTCFECGSPPPLHHHHVVPRSLGGTKTVPLCEACHGKVHAANLTVHALQLAAISAKRVRGELVAGKPPYGKRVAPDGVHLEDCPYEQDIMRRATCLHHEGITYREIARRLSAEGCRNRAGNILTDTNVRTFLPKISPDEAARRRADNGAKTMSKFTAEQCREFAIKLHASLSPGERRRKALHVWDVRRAPAAEQGQSSMFA